SGARGIWVVIGIGRRRFCPRGLLDAARKTEPGGHGDDPGLPNPRSQLARSFPRKPVTPVTGVTILVSQGVARNGCNGCRSGGPLRKGSHGNPRRSLISGPP